MIKPNDRSNGALKIRERDVSKTCIDYLKLRGWHCERQNAGPYGKTGVADYVAIHYRKRAVVWLEMKAPGDRRTCRCAGRRRGKCTVCAQAEFAQLVSSLGGQVLRVSDIDQFIEFYERTYGREGQLRLEAT